MAKINDNNIAEKVEIALKSKQGKNKKRIFEKLAQLQDKQTMLDKEKALIKDIKTYKAYISSLDDLLETLFEQINAPNVEDFIQWLSIITDKKNSNIDEFRAFLVKEYSEEINSSLENILSLNANLDKPNSIFHELLNNIEKNLKKTCNTFLDQTDQYPNNLKSFLSELSSILNCISNHPELDYTDISSLYTPEQIANNIDYYDSIIQLLLKVNQNLKSLSESDDEKKLPTKISSRINAFLDSIKLLDSKGPANNSDPLLKQVFLKFESDMVKFEGGIKHNLLDFLEKSWSTLIDDYSTIKNIFDNKILFEENNIGALTEFPKIEYVKALIANYNALLIENPLGKLLTFQPLGITRKLQEKSKEISKLHESCNEVKNFILGEFSKRIEEYKSQLIPMIALVAEKDSNIGSVYNDLKDLLDGLTTAWTSLNSNTDVLNYIKNDFTTDVQNYLNISAKFNEALQKSGKKEHLDWLDGKMIGSKESELTAVDLTNPQIIKELLADGLIKVTIKKQF